jgi:hypothetical protein
MVVMVVFIILYLVVFQLHYTTKLEERLSRARSADALGSAAIRSIMFYIMELLAEDYQKGTQSSSSTASGATSGTGAGGTPTVAGGGTPAGGASAAKTAGPASSAGTDPTTAGASATGSPTWTDYLNKDLFLANEKNLNDTTVKIRIRDNERCFDLNRLWDYPPSEAETVSETNQDQADAAARQAAGNRGLSDVAKADPTGQVSKALSGGKSTGSKSTASSGSKSTSGARTTPGTAGAAASQTADEQASVVEFVPPSPEKRADTVKMLSNAIEYMYGFNTTYGFSEEYKAMPPNAAMLAEAIERYCFERRSQNFQNYIHLTSELLNVLAMMGVEPELARKVYYGPEPVVLPGEDYFDATGEFRYNRDDYGDLVGEYVNAEDLTADREAMQSQLAELQGMFGQYQDFSSLGFGRMGNPMTQGMKEYSEVEDEKGNVSLKVPPEPLGLKDIFTTFSTGKININTASAPVLYSLLFLIIDTEPDGKGWAETIAGNIQKYRDTYQSEYDDTDPIQSEQKTSSAGAPHLTPSADGTKSPGGPRKSQTGAAGPSNLTSLSPEELAAAAQSGGRSDYQTNYFTNLQQLKLIDGEDGTKDDYLTDKNASTSVELAKKSPLDKVIHDYQQMMVFGSTYFTATLKAKTKDSSAVKTGYLTILRDIPQKRMEVIQWKELQR